MTYLYIYLVSLFLCFVFAKFRYKDAHIFWIGLFPALQQVCLLFCFWDLFRDDILDFVSRKTKRFSDWIERRK